MPPSHLSPRVTLSPSHQLDSLPGLLCAKTRSKYKQASGRACEAPWRHPRLLTRSDPSRDVRFLLRRENALGWPVGQVRFSAAFPFILYVLQPPPCLWRFTGGLSLQLHDDDLCGGGHGGGQRSAPLEEDGSPPGVSAALGSAVPRGRRVQKAGHPLPAPRS